MSRRRRIISRPLFVTGLSLAAFALLALLLWSPWDRARRIGGERLRFYCAAGMTRPVGEILADYQRQHRVTFEVSYDGSGKLLSSIRAAGGEGDLYLAADSADMDRARRDGLVAEVIPVAQVHPVLVVNRKTQEELARAGKPLTTLRDLLRDDLRVALADEGTAIGVLTRQRLEQLGLWGQVRQGLADSAARISTVGTVNEVAQRVQARDGFVGIVWSATASQFDDLVAIEVPEFAGVTEQVQIGVLSRSANPTAALRFARYLAGRNAGQEVFARHHFDTIPDADVWEETPELTVDAGAMLEPAIAGVLTAFQQREGVRINTSYAGCGLLVTKMRNLKAGKGDGRFPDAYVSCDVSFQERVQQWFDAADAILENDIVIVVARGNPKEVRSLSDLTRSDLRIGLPHPQNSALGELIDTMLMQLGLHSAVYQPGWQDRIVHSDAAHTLVNQLRSRALDVAVVGRSNARSAPQNAEHLEVIDLDVAGALATQTFAIARDSQHKYLLRRLLAALVAPANAERAQAIGFRFIYGKGTDGQRDPGPARP